jgi:fermentation-respiration switch protein FrsA (DUF1100 family)
MKALLLSAALTAFVAVSPAQAAKSKRVVFESNGERLVGNLYLPDGYRKGDKLPGVVVSGAWLTVKEQMPANYARAMADRGFAALAFDFRNFGESGGAVRNLESGKLKAEDMAAAVQFLRAQPEVSGKIGFYAICGTVGYAAQAIAGGLPVQAFATTAAWVHDEKTVSGVYPDGRFERLLAAGRAATAEYQRSGRVSYVAAATMDQTDDLAAMRFTSASDYYVNKERGAIAAWDNRFPVMAWKEFLEFDGVAPAASISVPTIIVHSDNSALPDNVRRFHANLKGPKSLYWAEGNHLDFYDKPELVAEAADAVASYFHRVLS